MLVGWFAHRRGIGVRRLVVAVIVAVIGISFVWSLVSTSRTPIRRTSPRRPAWELGVGAVTAAMVLRIQRMPGRLLAGVSWLGLALIGYAAFAFTEGTLFPGSAAVVPVSGRPSSSAAGATLPGGSATAAEHRADADHRRLVLLSTCGTGRSSWSPGRSGTDPTAGPVSWCSWWRSDCRV